MGDQCPNPLFGLPNRCSLFPCPLNLIIICSYLFSFQTVQQPETKPSQFFVQYPFCNPPQLSSFSYYVNSRLSPVPELIPVPLATRFQILFQCFLDRICHCIQHRIRHPRIDTDPERIRHDPVCIFHLFLRSFVPVDFCPRLPCR